MTWTMPKRRTKYSRRGAAYGAWPISAGTTNEIRPPGRSRLAAATRNGAHEEVRPEKGTPSLAQRESAFARLSFELLVSDERRITGGTIESLLRAGSPFKEI